MLHTTYHRTSLPLRQVDALERTVYKGRGRIFIWFVARDKIFTGVYMASYDTYSACAYLLLAFWGLWMLK